MADESYQDNVYREQGANRLVVASGGSLDVESGGEIDIESGGSLKLAGTALTATAGEINAGSGAGLLAGATITVGAEAADTINVAIQLEDAAGADLAAIGCVWAYMSDDSGGDGVASAAASGGVAIGTDGSIIVEPTAEKVFLLQSEADGDIDLDVVEAGVDTWYLALVMPQGNLVVSGAITFA